MKHLVFAALLSMTISSTALAGGYGGSYYYGNYHYGHHGGGDDGAALLAGLVIGGLVGYFINEERKYRRAHKRRHYDQRYRYTEYDEYGGYRQYPVYTKKVAYFTPKEFTHEHCLMTREYTSEIEIDGEMKQAYGTKCLKADKTWVLGRLKLVPEFD